MYSRDTTDTCDTAVSIPPTSDVSIMYPKNYMSLGADLAICGVIEQESISFLRETFKGVLYLATDEGDDFGSEEGFVSLLSSVVDGVHLPINFHDPLWHQKDSHVYRGIAVEMFHEFVKALRYLPKPLIIVCSDGLRSSAVYAAYYAVQNNLSLKTNLEYSKSENFTYVSHAGLVHWVETVVSTFHNKIAAVIRQLYDPLTGSCTYLVADMVAKEACLIDPILESYNRDVELARQLDLNLTFIIETHIHSDHISSAKELKKVFPGAKTVVSEDSGVIADMYVGDEEELHFGSRYLVCRKTPGHTRFCCSFVMDDFSAVFTGDTLHARGCGRIDMQDGSDYALYNSVQNILFKLPANCIVYPGHDYDGWRESTIGEEKLYNPRLGSSKLYPTENSGIEDAISEKENVGFECFRSFMENLRLPIPKNFHRYIEANKNLIS